MRQIATNVKSLVIQSVISSASQFFVYKILYDAGGSGEMGQWAVILAVTTFIGITGGGIGSAVVKYIASPTGSKDLRSAQDLISAAFWLSLLLNLLLFLVLYFGGILYLEAALDREYSGAMDHVLGYALVGMIITSLAGVFLSVLDGYHQFSKRALIVSIGYVIYLVTAVISIPRHGLAGIAYSLIAQSVFVFIMVLTYLLARGILRLQTFFSFHLPSFKMLLGYGSSMQAINLVMLFFDPVVKYYITTFSGLQAAGYYEMANRLVLQVRNVLAGTGQVLVPKASELHGVDDEKLRQLVQKFIWQNNNMAICIYLVLLASGWLVSVAWLGSSQQDFLVAYTLMVIGWFFNSLSVPSYYYYLGTGELRANLLQHLLFAFTTVTVYLLIQGTGGSLATFAVPAFALVVGSIYLLYRFRMRIKVAPAGLFDSGHRLGVAVVLILAVAYLVAIRYLDGNVYPQIVSGVAAIFLVYFVVRQRMLLIFKSILRA